MTYSTRALIIMILFISLLSCKSNKVALGHLEGVWLLSNNKENDKLEYRRIENEKAHFGSILNISKDSTIIDSYVMKCPNGTGKSEFLSEGSWNINEKSLLITSTVPIDLEGQIFKIVQLNASKFVLAKVEIKK